MPAAQPDTTIVTMGDSKRVTAALAELRTVGIQVEDDGAQLDKYRRDWWPPSAKTTVVTARPLPVAVAYPASHEEVAAVLAVARRHGHPVVAVGGRSNVVGAGLPTAGTIALDLIGLDEVGPVNVTDLTVRVGAGVFGGVLEEGLNARGYTVGHYPQSLHLSTVGGWISTKATGQCSTGYGGIEDIVVGLEVALPDGSTYSSQPGPRPVGPHLDQVFIGAEGTLGVITTVTLRILPQPRQRQSRSFDISDEQAGLDVIRRLVQRKVPLAAVRLYDRAETLDMQRRRGTAVSGLLLVVALEGEPPLVDAADELLTAELTAVGAHDLGDVAALAWLEHRYQYEWLIEGNQDAPASGSELRLNDTGRMADAIEISAPWSQLSHVVDAVHSALSRHADEVWHHYSHFYATGASVYFILFFRRDTAAEALAAHQAAWHAAMTATLVSGGAIAHHHGIGRARQPWVDRQLTGSVSLLRTLKSALDPEGVLNPGGFLTTGDLS